MHKTIQRRPAVCILQATYTSMKNEILRVARKLECNNTAMLWYTLYIHAHSISIGVTILVQESWT